MVTPLSLSRRRNEGGAARKIRRTYVNEDVRRYFLEVKLQVAAANQVVFEEEAAALLPTFEEAGLRLIASAWRTSADPLFAVNYWDLGGDANVLLQAELALPDIPQFNEFNRLIGAEVKTLCIPIALDEVTPLPPADHSGKLEEYRYLRVSTIVNSTLLAEFGARIEGYMAAFTRDNGWFLGQTFYSMTGNAGSISQLWVIPATEALAVSEKLANAPWLQSDLSHARPKFDILRATSADPNLDSSTDPA